MSLPRPATRAGSSFRDRPFADVIQERFGDLTLLRNRLESVGLLEPEHDDVLLIRYLLGFGTVEHAMAALKAADDIKCQKGHVLEAAEAARPLECAGRIEPHQKLLAWEVAEGQAMYIIRAGQVDCKALLAVATAEEITDYVLFLCRSMWTWVDRTSRAAGCIRKYDVVIDLHGFDFTSWEKIPPAAYRDAVSLAGNMSEVLHPLAQGSNTVIGFPGISTLRALFALVRPLLPRSIAATQFCPGNRARQSVSACPYIAKHYGVGAESMPEFLGGTCPATGRKVIVGALAEAHKQVIAGGLAEAHAQVIIDGLAEGTSKKESS